LSITSFLICSEFLIFYR